MKTTSSSPLRLVARGGCCMALVLLCLTHLARAQQYSFSTLAGTPELAGTSDSGALFNQQSEMARDSSGNIFVADFNNHVIRKIAPGGVVSTFAGVAGAAGSTDDVGAGARFNGPSGLAIDSSNNLYVADVFNHTIRKITPLGSVTRFAGQTGSPGAQEGAALTAARFTFPSRVAVDGSGIVYVPQSSKVRRISGGVVSTFAGSDTSGSADGIGAAAQFSTAAGMAVDASSRYLYVCDATPNNTIRRIEIATGSVTTIAGLAGSAGTTDGTGNAARFSNPNSIAVDGTSNTLFVTDANSNTVRRITPSGQVTTLCGLAGNSGTADGVGSNARFNFPNAIIADGTSNTLLVADRGNTIRRVGYDGTCTTWVGTPGVAGWRDTTTAAFSAPLGIARDSSGNLFVADLFVGVRKITPSGVISTFATGLSNPRGVAIDSANNLYVLETGIKQISKITPGGVRTVVPGNPLSSSQTPVDVKVDSLGNLFVTDSGAHTILKVTPAGAVSTFAGTAGSPGNIDAVGAAARFNNPAGLAIDAGDNLYVADASNRVIRKITNLGAVSRFAGQGAQGSADGLPLLATFHTITGIACDAARNLYVCDQGNHTLRKISPTGEVRTLCGLPGSAGSTEGVGSAARLNGPQFATLDPQGNLFVTCTFDFTVRKVTAGGAMTLFAGAPGVQATTNTGGVFNTCAGVAVDAAGNTYVADAVNHTIRKITPVGAVSTLAGLAGAPGNSDGAGTSARFAFPYALTIDGFGNVFVADTGNHAIRKVTPAGVVTTFAGQPGFSGSADGVGPAAQFNGPYGICIDPTGASLYVADLFNNTIRRVGVATGSVTTIAGSAAVSGTEDGTGGTARFNQPNGVAADALGNVFVAEYTNNAIRQIGPGPGYVVTTLAGLKGTAGSIDGTGTAARFSGPTHLAIDGAANLYVTDYFNHSIRKVTPAGVVTTVAGLAGTVGTTDGIGTAARFNSPSGIALDAAGNLYIGDEVNHAIRKGTRYGAKARIVEPALGAALPAPTTTLRWEPGLGATGYALWVGSAPGGYDLYAGYEGTNLFRTVALPPNIKVYVTLYSIIGGAYLSNSYAYEPAPSQKAVLTSPAQGSTLTSAALNLQWASGTGSSGYAVWVGSAFGGYDLGAAGYGAGVNTGTFTVPTDGGPIYVRLWSLINGAYQSNDYWFITQIGFGNRPATITNPTNGSTLASPTNFIWDTGVGGTAFALWVGSTPDSYDLYAGSESTTSRFVYFPSDGRKIYVTLFSLIGGVYQSNSYQYTAPGTGAASAGSFINNPPMGAAQGSATLPCGWSVTPGATNYVLYVGSAPGGYDIYAGSEGLNTSKNVIVPTDGRVLHLTIWTLMGGTYFPQMSWNTAQNTGGTQRAQLTSHAQYTSLPSASTTFSWNAGTGATGYALWVGSTPNSYDIYAFYEGVNTSRAVTLPTDGRKVYVTLYSLISGAYLANSYIFFAPQSPLTKATLISPANASTLTGSSAAFNWQAGTGVTKYYLFIGSQAGAYDIYIGDQNLGLNSFVPGLPTDGRPLHVTLYSLINGAYQASSYVFNAWQTP